MTTEEKAKAYDEAKQRAQHALDCDRNGLVRTDKSLIFSMFPELAEALDEKIRKELIKETKGSEVRLFEAITNDEFVAWLEKQGEQKPNGCNHLAELAEGEVTTANGISEDMMSVRIEHTSLSTRAKILLRYQFDTIGDLVSYCDGKWRRLRALRNIGKVTYNEIMEYLGVDDRL